MNQKILISILVLALLSLSLSFFLYTKRDGDQPMTNDQTSNVEKTREEAYEDIQVQYENSNSPSDNIPLPLEEDIISLFFHLINERRIPEAIDMLSSNMAYDDTTKQAWGVQLNDMRSVNIMNIEPQDQKNWSENKHKYKVTLEIYVDANAADAPIPFYGYGDNPNIRWLTLIKEDDGLWKIDSINTGP